MPSPSYYADEINITGKYIAKEDQTFVTSHKNQVC
jgi:hypothetical protein